MDEPTRTPPPLTGDERSTLTAFLQWHRDTFAQKCAGLTTDQLRERAVPPSALSLLGLVRHLAEVERSWFRRVLNGEDCGFRWKKHRKDQTPFEVATADPGEAFAAWHEECAGARRLEEATPSLDTTTEFEGVTYSLRWILVHMIEEYARHNGHADLLRERLDGTTGA
ncbi:DinB family protein [Spirillospora sp. NPDC047279]|uniref:DinB family protein n=1 Tax=Spirillospora sp. NPDC047279 TaxID=3155478 RepID=UPI0033F24CF3